MRNKRMMEKGHSFDYCGKHYGFLQYVVGFIVGMMFGILTSEIMYEEQVFKLILGLIFGSFGSKTYVSYLISRRKREFADEFCDYLDAISSSLACGKNTYEAFIAADEDMQDLYKRDSPICIEAHRLADGLKSGRVIDELIDEMAKRSGNEDVQVFGEVYGICNSLGANLKEIVSETKQTVVEKASIEAEIRTALTAPKNELNIMSIMPLIITLALKTLGNGFVGENTLVINSIALIIFAISYGWGRKIVKVKV